MRKLYFKWASYLVMAVLIVALALTFVLCTSTAQAEDFVYLEADVNAPATVQYTGESVNFDFTVWQSADKKTWSEAADSKSSFEIVYYTSANSKVPVAAPSAVGSYFAVVQATEVVEGAKNTAATPQSVVAGTVVCKQSFTICYSSFTVVSDASAFGNVLVLNAANPNYNGLASSVKVLLDGNVLNNGYTVKIQRKNNLVWEDCAQNAVESIGTYRFEIAFSGVDISATAAAVNLENVAGSYIYHEEFSVISQGVSLRLNKAYVYADSVSAISLSDESKSLLSGVVSYSVDVYGKTTGAGGVTVLRKEIAPSGQFTPQNGVTGEYVLRVTFNGTAPAYGIEEGSFVDLPFTVKSVPYTVQYYVNGSGSGLGKKLDYSVYNSTSANVEITPVFYALDGSPLGAVYKDGSGEAKYSVSYKLFNSSYGDPWQDISVFGMSKPGVAGRYQIVVRFDKGESVQVTSDYRIMGGTAETGAVITREFQVVTDSAAALSATPKNNSVFYYNGSGVIPEIDFLTSSGNVNAQVAGKYEMTYYTLNGDPISAPSAIGKYQYEVKFTADVQLSDTLTISAGTAYRGYYTVAYRGISVAFNSQSGDVSFTDKVSGGAIAFTNGSDYSVRYYSVGGINLPCAGLPVASGSYVAAICFTAAQPLYNIKAGDVITCAFTNISTDVVASWYTSGLNLTYDGGAKTAEIIFERNGTVLVLNETADYKITYYKLGSDESYTLCGYPVTAGTYKAVATLLYTDSAKGFVAGASWQTVYAVKPADVQVKFAVSEASEDLVYDGTGKTFDVQYIRGGRTVDYAGRVVTTYAQNVAEPLFSGVAPINKGNYIVQVAFKDAASSEQESLRLNGNTMQYSIAALEMSAVFTVPTSYNAMYSGNATEPVLGYLANNGRYAGECYSEADWQGKGIALGASVAYDYSLDGSLYAPAGTPVKTGKYKAAVTASNANVAFTDAASVADGNADCEAAYVMDGVCYVVFEIIPREVALSVQFDEDLYYTTLQKGVKSVAFYKYSAATEGYTEVASEISATDYEIYYYASNSEGAVSFGSGSTEKPSEKGFYVARVRFNPDGTDDLYVTDGYYTFVDGCTAVGEGLDGARLAGGSYVDFVFRIKPQTALDVVLNSPQTFASDGTAKTFTVDFVNKFVTIGLVEGDDYTITYLDADGNPTEVRDAGKYTLELTFAKEHTAYVIANHFGNLTAANVLYISAGDVITYGFEIFAQRSIEMTLETAGVSRTEDDMDYLYYDGTAKSYNAAFTTEAGGVKSAVMVTYNTHYRTVYYKQNADGVYVKIDGAPTVPGSYAAEIVMLASLLDYSYNGATLTQDAFVTIEQNGGVLHGAGEVNTCYKEFVIQKALLAVEGLGVQNKVFDGNDTATFAGVGSLAVVKDAAGKDCGAIVKQGGVFPFVLTGEVKGRFESVLPAVHTKVQLTEAYALSGEGSNYYTLVYPDYYADITKSVVTVTPASVSREYNPFVLEQDLAYDVAADSALVDLLYPDSPLPLLCGKPAREDGTVVGVYAITLGTIAFNEALPKAFIEGQEVAAADLFELKLAPAQYRITKRAITVEVAAGQGKVYGESDGEFNVEITSGKLMYRDSIVCNPVRASGENVGTYRISLNNVRIQNSLGVDVSENYNITAKGGTYEITKCHISIKPNNQSATYAVGFNGADMRVYRLYEVSGKQVSEEVTNAFVTAPTSTGDRLDGSLKTAPTDNPCVFAIVRGSVKVVDFKGKDVSSNYVIDFTENQTYTVQKTAVEVSLDKDAVLTKYYGDAEPVIKFTLTSSGEKALGKCTLSAGSSVGRAAGENVGTYLVKNDNSAGSFVVLDGGVDVSAFFTFSVKGVSTGKTLFEIKPRPITVTVADAEYDNTGREIIPEIRYYNANGTKLSVTVQQLLKVQYGVQEDITYADGKNEITPIVVGNVTEDANFDITVKSGVITLNYLQNCVNSTVVDKTDKMYKSYKYVLSGIMLYKTVKIYKLETLNGEQPTRKVEIALPVDETMKGDGMVAVALYENANPKAFAFRQEGDKLIYTDNGAYYVAIAEVQEWFYIIWGVVLILVAVGLYFVCLVVVRAVKKSRKKKAANAPERNAAKAAKQQAAKEAKAQKAKEAEAEKQRKAQAAAEKKQLAEEQSKRDKAAKESERRERERKAEAEKAARKQAEADKLAASAVSAAPESAAPESVAPESAALESAGAPAADDIVEVNFDVADAESEKVSLLDETPAEKPAKASGEKGADKKSGKKAKAVPAGAFVPSGKGAGQPSAAVDFNAGASASDDLFSDDAIKVDTVRSASDALAPKHGGEGEKLVIKKSSNFFDDEDSDAKPTDDDGLI